MTKDANVDKNTKQLNKKLEQDRIRSALEIKILCLGAGESGKSTFLKQLNNIYVRKEPLSSDEKKRYREVLSTNIKDTMQSLITICEKMGIDLGEMQSDARLIDEASSANLLSPEEKEAVARLWASEPIQKAFESKDSFYIPDSAPYYFEHLERIASDDFEPTEEDVVMARVRTTGMVITDFSLPPLNYKVIDVGGQRSERKKWLRSFDDVNAVFFVVNLAGYTTVLFEDEKKNRLMESLELFEEIISRNYFDGIPLFFFFNKKDLFEQYLKKASIKTCFPDYSGAETTAAQMEFIRDKFLACVVPEHNSVEGVNFIAARFKKDVKYAFEDAKQILTKLNQKTIERAQNLKS